MAHAPRNWYEKVLHGIGVGQKNHQNARLMMAWAQAEGGSAENNPLNTTFPLPGATDYNSAGVKNYTRPAWGVAAIILTLTGPASGKQYYAGILADLKAHIYTAEQIVDRRKAEFKLWGTNPDTILACLKTIA